MGVARQMIDIDARMLAVIQRHQPCTMQDIRHHMTEYVREAVDLCRKRLAESKKIANVGTVSSGLWAIARPGLQTAKAKAKPKPPKKVAPPSDNLAPGRLIEKMIGNWVPPKPVMRPGANDHEKHPSLRSGVRYPFIGQTLSMRSGR